MAGNKETALKNLEKIKGKRGRKQGSQNKFTSFKQSCLDVYTGIGGDEAFIKWASQEKNQGEFYKMMTKLLPKTIEGTGENGAIVIRINNAAKRD